MWFMWLWMVFLVSDSLCRFHDFSAGSDGLRMEWVMDDNDVSVFCSMAGYDFCGHGSVVNHIAF
jgi:hypothetical protein